MRLYVTFSGMHRVFGTPSVGRMVFDGLESPTRLDAVLEIEKLIGEQSPDLEKIFLTFWCQLEG